MDERLKKWFPPWKHYVATAVVVLFLVLILWNKRNFVGYFPEWLSRQMSSHVIACFIAMALAYLGKWAVASGLTLGWVAGVPIAQAIGEARYVRGLTLITPDMTAEQLSAFGPKHAYIWFICIAVGVLLGIVVQLIFWLRRKDRKRLPPVSDADLARRQTT